MEYAILTDEITKAWSGKNIEAETGKPVVTQRNAIDFAQLIGDVIIEKDNK